MTTQTDTAPPVPEDIAGLSFEEAFRALEATVADLEGGDPSLDEALELYERGVALSERCNELLSAAELRVRQVDGEGEDAGPLAL